jgi:hypothetical protein
MSGLEELRRLETAATNLGEWETTRNNDVVIYAPNGFGAYRLIAHADTKADAEFIVAARNQLPSILAALDAVLALHQPVDALMYGAKNAHKVQVCTGCGQDDGNWNRWPCPTVAAITDTMEGKP